ncbi:hypothetical protein [Cupriavidus sp. TMH.W2]|uniref:hypothetical protein n=1 Tax=Cupriavidus sp. TMH.W2 TaxID=3434465 RepID=UPI003D7753CD
MVAPSPPHNDHRRLDLRSLALHRMVADKLAANPALLEVAQCNLIRWREHMRGTWLDEWDAYLNGPFDQLLAFLREDSETATRLRQSSPFAGILTEQERLAIYESYSARTHHPGREPHLG